MKKVSALNVRSKRYPSYNEVTILMIHERDKRMLLQSFSTEHKIGTSEKGHVCGESSCRKIRVNANAGVRYTNP